MRNLSIYQGSESSHWLHGHVSYLGHLCALHKSLRAHQKGHLTENAKWKMGDIWGLNQFI